MKPNLLNAADLVLDVAAACELLENGMALEDGRFISLLGIAGMDELEVQQIPNSTLHLASQ
jgi:hypothetical protein